jgi:hypothetical protein
MLQLGRLTHFRSLRLAPVRSPAHRLLQACILVGWLTLGCNGDRSANSSTESPPPASDTEHEHFPSHWPFTIDRASERLNQLTSQPDTTSDPSSVSVAHEFADLWLWLPLLAADSDLKRSDFEKIDQWSQTWAPICRTLADNQQPLSKLTAPPELQTAVHELEILCQRERQRLEQLQP